ncbi:MAG TPA: type II toxin-antitoxin system Phd/YefM family antitoxin [Blastocatellia bacterium]|nr:type II toxin-antitoxin system Phd/YefM family antitoxin [Blastocatellia bacterium]
MLDVHNSSYSLSDFKRNDPEVTERLEKTGEPVILTVNSKAKYVLLDTANYQKMAEALEDAKILRAIAEMKAGKGRPVEAVFAKLAKNFEINEQRKK